MPYHPENKDNLTIYNVDICEFEDIFASQSGS
jgi:hypothetical protein